MTTSDDQRIPGPMFDVSTLYDRLDNKREQQGLSWKGIAHDIGISPSGFSRMAIGAVPDVHTLSRLLLWLGDTDIGPYIDKERS